MASMFIRYLMVEMVVVMVEIVVMIFTVDISRSLWETMASKLTEHTKLKHARVALVLSQLGPIYSFGPDLDNTNFRAASPLAKKILKFSAGSPRSIFAVNSVKFLI